MTRMTQAETEEAERLLAEMPVPRAERGKTFTRTSYTATHAGWERDVNGIYWRV